jgi:hypothetical protein
MADTTEDAMSGPGSRRCFDCLQVCQPECAYCCPSRISIHKHLYFARGEHDVNAWLCTCGDTFGASLARHVGDPS